MQLVLLVRKIYFKYFGQEAVFRVWATLVIFSKFSPSTSGSHFQRTCAEKLKLLHFAQQVGNLSAHALQFARFKRKRLGASKYSNLIFERFIGVFSLVFSANQKIFNPLHCWEHEEGMRTFRG
jgi:hypothetical protein